MPDDPRAGHVHPEQTSTEHILGGALVEASKSFTGLADAVLAKVVERGTTADVVEVVANFLDGYDALDDDNIALIHRAQAAAGQPTDEPTEADPRSEVERLRDALAAAGHGWRVAQEAVDREVAEHRRSNDRLNEEIARLGVAREQLRKRLTAEAEQLRASRDEWKACAAECKAGTFHVTDGTLDDWLVAMRRGNDIVFSHARAAGLADEIDRLRALVGGRSAAPTRDEVLTLSDAATRLTLNWRLNERIGDDIAALDEANDAVVALLSRSAAEPPEDHPLTMVTAIECPRCGNDRTPGMDGLMSATCSRCGTLAEPVPTPESWPGEVFPARGRWAFRCGIDGCEMNGTGYATRDDAERRLRTHGATETCPYTYARGVAAEPNEETTDGP